MYFMEIILVVLPEHIPGCYHARQGSLRTEMTTTTTTAFPVD